MQFNRRNFLKGTGGVFTTLGLSDALIHLLDPGVGTAMAQPSPRKLALLVGINQYQNRAKLPDLKGCVMDLFLVRNLLIYRFGFNPADIIMLRNEEATRDAIEQLFQSHLIDQAQSSDVVFFHFSGFGRYFLPQSENMSNGTERQRAQQYGLIPFDVVAAPVNTEKQVKTNAILQDTLYLLLQSLKTERVVTILDTGFHFPGTSILEHSRVRALPAKRLQDISKAEYDFQEQLLNHTKIKRSQLTDQRKGPPGAVVTAAYLQQSGVELAWSGFEAGALTYALTQELWHTVPSSVFSSQLSRCSEFLAKSVSLTQQPELTGHKKLTLTRDVMGLPQGISGDGIVFDPDGKGRVADIWLGGLAPVLLKDDDNSAYFSVVSATPSSTTPSLIKLSSRKGLAGTVRLLKGDPLVEGEQLKERFRIIGRSQPLSLALSSKLERVELVDATSVFSGIGSLVKVVNRDEAADIVLTKLERQVPQEARENSSESSDSPNTSESKQVYYCLCSLAGDVFPNTVSDKAEAIKNKEQPFLPTLQALSLRNYFDLLVNPTTTELAVSASLSMVTESGAKNSLLTKSSSVFAKGVNTITSDITPGQILTLSIDTPIQFCLSNGGSTPVYAYVFAVDARPTPLVIFNAVNTPEETMARNGFQSFTIEPGVDRVLPSETDGFDLYGPSGIGNIYILFTNTPLPLADKAINVATKNTNKGTQPKFVKLSDPIDLSENLLTDLHQASAEAVAAAEISDDKVWILSMGSWAALKFTYHVI